MEILTDPFQIFSIAGTVAMAGWATLIIGPRRIAVVNIIPRYIIPVGLSGVYTALMLANLSSSVGGFEDLRSLSALFQSEWILLAGWIHFLAFDLFVGAYLSAEMDRTGFSRIIQAPILILGIFFAPAAFTIIMLASSITRTRAVIRNRVEL